MDMVTSKPDVAPTEVTPKAKRRTFSPAFKRAILDEADAAAAKGVEEGLVDLAWRPDTTHVRLEVRQEASPLEERWDMIRG